jgi:CheY-like chemotaxis protein
MNGFETIRILRRNAPDVPIIAMTAYAYGGGPENSDILETAIELGATQCLHKPLMQSELTEAIRMCRAVPALVA